MRYPSVLTIGHSTRTLEAFIALLGEHQVEHVADVRSIPRSRRNPQFNRDTLPGALLQERIGYSHVAGLGGFRRPLPDSPNTKWRNEGFRGFADYMQTSEFVDALERLLNAAETKVTAIMCAEALPWRCHRSLIADSLLVRGVSVTHILGPGKVMAHRLTDGARVNGVSITYP